MNTTRFAVINWLDNADSDQIVELLDVLEKDGQGYFDAPWARMNNPMFWDTRLGHCSASEIGEVLIAGHVDLTHTYLHHEYVGSMGMVTSSDYIKLTLDEQLNISEEVMNTATYLLPKELIEEMNTSDDVEIPLPAVARIIADRLALYTTDDLLGLILEVGEYSDSECIHEYAWQPNDDDFKNTTFYGDSPALILETLDNSPEYNISDEYAMVSDGELYSTDDPLYGINLHEIAWEIAELDEYAWPYDIAELFE